MKKIALIMDGWKQYITTAWVFSILDGLRIQNIEANLYVFNSFGEWSLDNDYNIGEYNIYNLPSFDDFDVIIMDWNSNAPDFIVDNVIQKIKKSGKPAISIEYKIDDFYYVGLKNGEAMEKMIHHLHIEKKCNKFWFAMGPKNNQENQERVRGLKDYLNKNNISYDEDTFYYGNFETKSGRQAFRNLYYKYNDTPDAIICANDNIAVGVIEEANRHSFSVPNDILVTGFDDFDKALFYSPKLTTVSFDRNDIGLKIAYMLKRLWDGEEIDEYNYIDFKCSYRESTGCDEDVKTDYIEHEKDNVLRQIQVEEFNEEILTFEYNTSQKNNIHDILSCIPKYLPSLFCDSFYFLFDRDIKDLDYTHIINDKNITEYPKNLSLAYGYDYLSNKEIKHFDLNKLFPYFASDEPLNNYLFLPIHFGKRSIGTFVLKNANDSISNQILFPILNSISNTLQNWYKNNELKYTNEKLSSLYVTDNLTGIFNRIVFNEIAPKYYIEKRDSNQDFTILFIDLDKLKYINDNFDHEMGDLAIRLVANTISKFISYRGLAIRYGGDEFVAFTDKIPNMDAFIYHFNMELEKIKFNEHLPFDLSASIGYVHTDIKNDKKIDDYKGIQEKILDNYINIADEIMYINKKNKNR